MWLPTISSISSAIIDQFLSLTQPPTALENSIFIGIHGMRSIIWQLKHDAGFHIDAVLH